MACMPFIVLVGCACAGCPVHVASVFTRAYANGGHGGGHLHEPLVMSYFNVDSCQAQWA